MLMETPRPPMVILMWLTVTGFDKLMPEGRRAPWEYLPRPLAGALLRLTFGAPLARATLEAQQSESKQADVEKTRISLTELVQCAVEDVGRQVSGDLLDGVPHQRT